MGKLIHWVIKLFLVIGVMTVVSICFGLFWAWLGGMNEEGENETVKEEG